MNISADATSTSQRLLKSPKRIAKSPSSATDIARNIVSASASKARKQHEEESDEQASAESSSTFKSYKRKYTPSPLSSPVRQPALGSRSSTFNSVYDINTPSSTRWTKEHWKKLEQYYIERNRDYKRAADAFYLRESLINIELPQNLDGREPETKDVWSKGEITWRCQCLDTSAKFHNGLLPSERKKAKKRKLSNNSSNDISNQSSSDIPGLFKSPSAMSITTASPSSSISSTPNRTPNRTPNHSTLSFTATAPTRTATAPTFERSTSFSTPSRIGNSNSYQSSSSSFTR